MSAEVVTLIAAAVAVFSAVLAVRATALVARTVLAHQQGPQLAAAVTIVDGQTRRDLASDTRDYVFVVSATNPSTAERRFSVATLRVTYRTRANFLGAVDLVDERTDDRAGRSIRASLRFTTRNVIPRHCRIDAYTVLLVNENGERLPWTLHSFRSSRPTPTAAGLRPGGGTRNRESSIVNHEW